LRLEVDEKMSSASLAMDMQNVVKRKYLVLLHKWLQREHPEIIEEWEKTSQIYSHSCVRQGT